MLNRAFRNLAALAALLLLCARAEASAQPHDVVNLNTATVAELQFLPGVGESLAARIVAGRPYASPADLAKVKGFGGDGKRLAALRPYIVTSGPTTLHAKIPSPKTGPRPKPAASLDSQRDLSLYSSAARASIVAGLADGHVRFEPSQYGGEYIWFPDGAR